MSVRVKVLLTILTATFLVIVTFAVFLYLFQGALLIIATIEMVLGTVLAVIASDIIARVIDAESDEQDLRRYVADDSALPDTEQPDAEQPDGADTRDIEDMLLGIYKTRPIITDSHGILLPNEGDLDHIFSERKTPSVSPVTSSDWSPFTGSKTPVTSSAEATKTSVLPTTDYMLARAASPVITRATPVTAPLLAATTVMTATAVALAPESTSVTETALTPSMPESRPQSHSHSHSQRQKVTIADLQVEGIDIVRALERYQGDDETLCEVLSAYAASLKREVEKLEFRNSLIGVYTQGSERYTKSVYEQPEGYNEYENRAAQGYDFGMRFDFDGYQKATHNIKSASFGVCADELGNIAEGLEYAAKDRNISYIIENNVTFVLKALVLSERLGSIVAAVNYGKEKPKRDKLDEKTLVRLMDACVRADVGDADQAMKELECYEYTGAAACELAVWLRERFDKYDFESITKRLSVI